MSASHCSGNKRQPTTIDSCDIPAHKKHCLKMSAHMSFEATASANDDMEICSNSNGEPETCKRRSDIVINMPNEVDASEISDVQEFADDSIMDQNDSSVHVIDESTSFEEDEDNEEEGSVPDDSNIAEQEKQSWQGTNIAEIKPVVALSELPCVFHSSSHKVMYKLPFKPNCVPKPDPQDLQDFWIQDHVRMPYSIKSKYPVRGVPNSFQNRWEMIKEALETPINTINELETAILSYNHTYGNDWNFSLLHFLFNEEYNEEETQAVFGTVLPGIIELALRLPSLITRPIPLLMAGISSQLSLSQLQIASLLANAFLCTFPRRNAASRKPSGEFSNYPQINFNGLYRIPKDRSINSSLEKVKCLLNYFRRITTETPQGTVTFSRRNMKRDALPTWSDSNKKITRLHVTSSGTIEDDGINMLQVDFANRMVGGGVLGSGCVQEEIRFVICPELIVSRLFTECLTDTEALVISGVERYSNYQGYARTFEFVGDYNDPTSQDASGRKHCSIVAIDALLFHSHTPQFHPNKLNRELNKAFVGFHAQEPIRTKSHSSHSPRINIPIATGNWGCGAFQGDKHLKAVLQILAAAQTGRDVAYFTFNDRRLRNELAELHNVLKQNDASVGQVYRALLHYHANYFVEGRLTCGLFQYLLAKFTPGATLPKVLRPITLTCSPKKNKTGGPGDEHTKNLSVFTKPQDNSQKHDTSCDSVFAKLDAYDANEDMSSVPNRPSTSAVTASIEPIREESLTESSSLSSSLQTNELSQRKKEKLNSTPNTYRSKFVEQSVTKNTKCDSSSSDIPSVKDTSYTNKISEEVVESPKNNSKDEILTPQKKITDYFSPKN